MGKTWHWFRGEERILMSHFAYLYSGYVTVRLEVLNFRTRIPAAGAFRIICFNQWPQDAALVFENCFIDSYSSFSLY